MSAAVVYLVLIDRYLITECSITPFPLPPHQPLAPRTPRRSLARLQKVSNRHPFATSPAEKETNLLRGDLAQTETESYERRGPEGREGSWVKRRGGSALEGASRRVVGQFAGLALVGQF